MWKNLLGTLDWKALAPRILRGLIQNGAGFLVAYGLLTPEQQAIVNENVAVIAGAIISIAGFLWMARATPSSRGLDAAHKSDEMIPADRPVVIETPGPAPNIVVQPK